MMRGQIKLRLKLKKMLYEEPYRNAIREKLSKIQTILSQPPQQGDIIDLTLEMLEEPVVKQPGNVD